MVTYSFFRPIVEPRNNFTGRVSEDVPVERVTKASSVFEKSLL